LLLLQVSREVWHDVTSDCCFIGIRLQQGPAAHCRVLLHTLMLLLPVAAAARLVAGMVAVLAARVWMLRGVWVAVAAASGLAMAVLAMRATWVGWGWATVGGMVVLLPMLLPVAAMLVVLLVVVVMPVSVHVPPPTLQQRPLGTC
jgi:hypothetical protein